MIRILLGGSPCTAFSIAQKNNRETRPNSGIGWELFKNYLIAKEKFKPDYFLYENNVSAAQPIKDEIKKQLGVWDGTFLTPYSDVRYIEINSALVSAQNRERFYVHNCGEVKLPTDRGILLRDVLESGFTDKDKAYCLKHQAGNARDYFKKHHTQVAFERIPEYGIAGKSRPVIAGYSCKGEVREVLRINALQITRTNKRLIMLLNLVKSAQCLVLMENYQRARVCVFTRRMAKVECL